jgi:hypothetical protein
MGQRGQSFSFDHYPSFFAVSGKRWLNARWLADDRIAITLPQAEKVSRRANAIDGVAITYSGPGAHK